MGSTPNAPQHDEQVVYETASTPRWVPIALVILLALTGYAVYSGYTSRQELRADIAKANERSDMLAKQLDQSNERIADLKGQLEVTSQKLGLTQDEVNRAKSLAASIRKEQKTADEQLIAQLGQVKQESDTKISQVATDVSGAKTDIAATRKDLEDAKSRLLKAVGDLDNQGTLIARNREEVEVLKRLGEKNIFEFDLRKSKQPQRVGPVQITLKKVDTKKFRYTMDLIADDKQIEKKDKTVNEPVQFYVRGTQRPYELVVFEVHKDRAVGYLTTPKS